MRFTLATFAAVGALLQGASAKDWEGLPYTWLYSKPLPIPPVKQPKMTVTNPVTNQPIDYYEVEIKPFTKQIYPNKAATPMIGYDGMSPGPTFLMEKGREAVVRFTNIHTMAASVHLHGSYSRAPWDGWAADLIPNQYYKDYYYPNSQSGRFLWYHDHAMDHTAENSYFGQAGGYILHDPAEDQLGLPSGYGQFDIPLILGSKQYKQDGTLFSPAGETDSLWGDVIHVNGEPWPHFKVQPRKYRFRILNGAVSRTFILYLRTQANAARIPFKVIASDAGLLSKPVTSSSLTISLAERYEIVVDFSAYAGQNLTLSNEDKISDVVDYKETTKVMQFVVSSAPVTDNSVVPANLRTIPAMPFNAGGNAVDHHYRFERQGGGWKINGVGWSDVNNRILANVPRGTVEIWELENGSGGWTHPIHIHLVDFKVLSRTGGRGVLPYEAEGLKDVVWLNKGETVKVEAHYAPWDGVYMFHCHNLIHEDHEMMAAFNVTQLLDLGYQETSFADPMEQRWRAKPVVTADFTTAAITQKVRSMALLQPYNNVNEVMQKLEEYWTTRGGARIKRMSRPQLEAPKS